MYTYGNISPALFTALLNQVICHVSSEFMRLIKSLQSTYTDQQGCSFVFSCVGLNPHNLGQSPHNLSEKVCQIRGEIGNSRIVMALSSFNRFSPHNCYEVEATPLLTR